MKLGNLFLFFVLAYLISWIIWLPLYLPFFGISGLPVLPYHHAFGAIGPLTAGIIMTFLEGGREGTNGLLSKTGRYNVPIIWHLIAFLSPSLMIIAGVFIYKATGKTDIEFKEILLYREFPEFTLFSFFLYNLISFGYGEETGWRGYALPKLQSKMHPFLATLLLTVLWAAWHIPLFFYRPGYTSMDVFGVLGWFFSLLTGAVLLTWLFNSTRQSDFIVAVFHATIDIAFTSNASTPEVSQYVGMIITFFGIAVLIFTRFKLGFKQRTNEPASTAK